MDQSSTKRRLDQPAVRIEGVDLSLGSGAARVHILKHVSLQIARGEAVGLVGPSGSGKSTLLMVMAGLERPNEGRVVVAGEDLVRLDEDALARFRGRAVGIVFQSFHLIPTMTALENVAVPLELAGREDAIVRAREELASVGLGERLEHYPDEPTGNLDEATGKEIMDLLFTIRAQRGSTLVIVTHDPALTRRCDRVIRMHSGIVEAASARADAKASRA
jgi:putative ABC transport system ATP-binding protein